MNAFIVKVLSLLVSAVLLVSIAKPAAAQQGEPLQRVGRILVIFQENHSFDNLFGLFPGANGIFNAGKAAIQVDEHGKPYDHLPRVRDTREHTPDRQPIVDERFPARMANAPFLIDSYVPQDAFTGDLVHRFYEEQKQINGGKMDRFAGLSDAGGLAMGYYDISRSALWRLAKEYTLGDNMFHSAFGGSFLNHIFLVCSCALRWDNAPSQVRDKLINGGVMTKDGYLVNTIQSAQLNRGGQGEFVPGQAIPHIGDRLDAKNIKWKWYSGGFKAALAGNAEPLFQFHHQPFVYFSNLEPGSPKQKENLRDLEDLYADIKNGTLPQVAFYKPNARNNLHPSYANFSDGDKHLGELIDLLMKSPQWSDTLVLITFDEHGGYWDHVAPPKRDEFGPGSRVPLIAVGTMVKQNFIDSTQYDFGSILKTIQERFGVDPVVEAIDGKATAMRNLLK
jgi:phospholipase C